MDEIRVSSWTELTDALYSGAWKEGLGRFRSDFAFRGLEVPEGELLTGLMRLGGDFAAMEGHLLRNFRKYAFRGAVPSDSPWNWLALGQHHGLPTRLLDWTFSPYVALHFVTEHTALYGSDGVVWCVDFIRAKQELPRPMREVLDEEGANVFTAEMLSQAAAGLREFDRLAEEPFAAFFEPPSLDDRIVNQFALFSLMSSPAATLDAWLRARPGLARRVVIPAALKWEVRDKLDQANVTERVLCPGLDGLSSWLRRQYAQPNSRAAAGAFDGLTGLGLKASAGHNPGPRGDECQLRYGVGQVDRDDHPAGRVHDVDGTPDGKQGDLRGRSVPPHGEEQAARGISRTPEPGTA